MAAMFTAKNALLNLSKPLYHNNPSFPLRPKVFRVCFTSGSRYSQVRRHAADDGGRRQYSPYNADEAMKESDVAGSADDVKEKAKEKAEDMTEKSKEELGFVAGKANEMREKTMDSAGMVADKTKEYAQEAKEKTVDTAGTAGEKTKGAAESMVGTAQSIGDKAKQTVQGAWGAAKDTTQKIKETVVGKSGEGDVGDYIEDHVKKPARETKEKVMDDDVVDPRRLRSNDDGAKKL